MKQQPIIAGVLVAIMSLEQVMPACRGQGDTCASIDMLVHAAPQRHRCMIWVVEVPAAMLPSYGPQAT